MMPFRLFVSFAKIRSLSRARNVRGSNLRFGRLDIDDGGAIGIDCGGVAGDQTLTWI
jgi:hypothetical protein